MSFLGIVLCVIKVGVAWAVLMFVGINLAGNVAAGFLHPFWKYEAPPDNPILARERTRARGSMIGSAIVFSALIVGFLVLLYRFWNANLVIAAVMLMLTRLPDQIKEIRTGDRIAPSNGVKVLEVASMVLMFGALPVLWLALC